MEVNLCASLRPLAGPLHGAPKNALLKLSDRGDDHSATSCLSTPVSYVKDEESFALRSRFDWRLVYVPQLGSRFDWTLVSLKLRQSPCCYALYLGNTTSIIYSPGNRIVMDVTYRVLKYMYNNLDSIRVLYINQTPTSTRIPSSRCK